MSIYTFGRDDSCWGNGNGKNMIRNLIWSNGISLTIDTDVIACRINLLAPESTLVTMFMEVLEILMCVR